MQLQETEIPAKRRKIDSYDEDVLKKNPTKTGIREWSSFNNLPHFHVVHSSCNDWMHVVLLGNSQLRNMQDLLVFVDNSRTTEPCFLRPFRVYIFFRVSLSVIMCTVHLY